MELDGFVVRQRVLFGQEGRSQGRLAVIVKFFIGEAGQDGGFADSSISHGYQFDLSNIALLVFYSGHLNLMRNNID